MERVLLVAGIVLVAAGASVKETRNGRITLETFGEAHRFIFMAVLEGYYEDGVSRADVNRILKQEPGQGPDHFIYACPLCTAVFQASQVYANRPDFSMYKPSTLNQITEATFGDGLSAEIQSGLASEAVETRLETLFKLVSVWVSRRLERSSMSPAERATLLAEFEAGKKLGMARLKGYKENSDKRMLESCAPGFANIDACAMCNASTNTEFEGVAPMDLQLDGAKGLLKK